VDVSREIGNTPAVQLVLWLGPFFANTSRVNERRNHMSNLGVSVHVLPGNIWVVANPSRGS
jgi:hypothetical protein